MTTDMQPHACAQRSVLASNIQDPIRQVSNWRQAEQSRRQNCKCPILPLYETGLISVFKGGMTHIFVVEFANEEDRTYYLEKDPVHLGFVKSIGGVVKNAQVVDFTPGVF